MSQIEFGKQFVNLGATSQGLLLSLGWSLDVRAHVAHGARRHGFIDAAVFLFDLSLEEVRERRILDRLRT